MIEIRFVGFTRAHLDALDAERKVRAVISEHTSEYCARMAIHKIFEPDKTVVQFSANGMRYGVLTIWRSVDAKVL